MLSPLPLKRVFQPGRWLWLCVLVLWQAFGAAGGTAFLNFNTPGQYTNNFNPWNDGGGVNSANYSFTESTNDGVGGSGGVAVFQSTDMTAIYTNSGWNLATNGATIVVSVLLYTDGQSSGDKVQLGFLNTTNNGLNSNAGVTFETLRFIASGATSWPLYEQYRTNGNTVSSGLLGTVTVAVNHWYKFVVAVTNTSGVTGNLAAGCALYDYGTDGLTPGTNIINFPTADSHFAPDLTGNPAVWPALRTFADAGTSAWDNFLVYQPNSPPVFTLTLTNTIVTTGNSASFKALADGPGNITYAWYTNNISVAGATNPVYTTAPVGPGFTNVTVVARNANGATTNTAAVNVFVPTPPQIASLAAANLLTTAATLGGQVLSTNGTTSVFVYYGPANGGTNAGNWANVLSLGVETGIFTQTITGLSPNTAYFFTVQGSNTVGVAWTTPARSFTTPPVTLPQVTNATATAIGATLATLNGLLLTNGGATTSVTLCYGPVDGGTNVALWSNTVALGPVSGAFAQTIGGLVTNKLYYSTARATNSVGTVWAVPSLHFTTLATNPPTPLTAVLTYQYDNTRMGVNSTETNLALANVNTNHFGCLFTCAVDGYIYAQPLVVPGVNIPGLGVHDVVYVVTEHNSVYAFDADNNTGSNAVPLWQTSFLSPGVTTVPSGDVSTSDITPEIGITSTPVIDPATATIYLEVKTKEPGSVYVHRLHALDITTGLERTNFNSPAVIAATNYPGLGSGDNDGETPAHVLWNPLREHSRPALTLLKGVIYMSFASHGDNTPYHGWLFGYNATNVSQQVSVYNTTPNGGLGGFWDGGGGPSVDAQGNLYLQSGNGTFDGGANVTLTNDYAMSVLKFSTTNGLKFVDYFAPSNAVDLSDGDADLGSSAALILPDSAGSAAHPHLVVGGGKTAMIYLMDRDNMGRFNGTAGNNLIVQEFNGSYRGDRDTSPAFFNNSLYVFDSDACIGAYSITNALFNTTPVETPDTYDNKGGATACISANGTNNAIVWALYNSGADNPTTPCVLRAYNATNLAQELYASDQLPARDSAGDAVKFTVPTVANGKVYVGAQYALSVYGIASAFVSSPAISPDGGVFTNSVTVTLSDATPGAAIYYTLDGSPPTTSSPLYTGPFVITNSGSVTTAGYETGAVPSPPVSAGFLNSSAIGNGTGLLGQYWANTTSSAFFTPGFNTAPTLTRVDPTINFNWDNVDPSTNIGPDSYVVSWTGSVVPQFNETYTFSTTTDDGVLLWVNGQLLVNEWVDQGPTTWSGSITLLAQQRYNIVMDYYQNGGGAVAQLFWSSSSTGPMTLIPETQLYPVTNPPPVVVLNTPTTGAVLTAAATVSLSAAAGAPYNPLSQVAFYINNQWLGSVTNPPYALTTTGLPAGSYALTAVAVDSTGLAATSAPVNITVQTGGGQPYGLTNAPGAPAFYNMPMVFAGTLPAQLSLTGIFTNTPAMTPAGGLISYTPNVPLWSDGAQKIRYFSVPATGTNLAPAEQIAYAPTGTWSFPAGTVFVKTFELQTNQSNPTALRRLETRLLVRDINGAVYGVTYKWRPDNSDADLLTNNLTEAIAILTPGGVITQNWYYPSPADCLQCHTAVANYVLGLNARQLNGSQKYPNGVTDNQLRALNRAGLLYPAIDESQLPGIESLAALTNTSASYGARARSYLDANCAQCHQPGGSGPTFDARYDTPLTNQNIVNIPAVKGSLGYDNVDIVTPNDVWRSSLYDRINLVNPSLQMPPLARNLIDTNAVQLMAAWINSLGGTPTLPPPTLAPPGGTFLGYVNVTLQPPTNPATLYYTLDGSLPTTNSLLYTGSFLLTNSAVLNVNAWATGYVNSVVGAAPFTIQPGLFFTSAGGFTNGLFQMTFAGTGGSNYVLQVSTNLMQWTAISTNSPTNNPFLLSDPHPAGTSPHFYRVMVTP